MAAEPGSGGGSGAGPPCAALVPGGGSGIGAACARHLAAAGRVVASLSPSGRGAALAAALGGVGVTGANRSEGAIGRLVEAARARRGRIDGRAKAAGRGPRGPVLALRDAGSQAGLESCFLAVVRARRVVTPAMERQGGGAVVNTASARAVEPAAACAISAVARAGLAAFCKIFADRDAPAGIRINTVLPGWIDRLPRPAERSAAVPMGRAGPTAETAATVAFLLSEGAGCITGRSLRVGGGLMRAL